MAGVMCYFTKCLRHLFFLAALVPAVANAQQGRIAESFVSKLISADDPVQMQALITGEVDIAYLMTTALGDRFQDMDEGQLSRFADGFSAMVVEQALVLSAQADGGHFTTAQEQRGADGIIVVGEAAIQSQSARYRNVVLDVQLLVRREQSSGREMVADVFMEGRWVSSLLSDVVDQLFELTGGDVELVVSSLETSLRPRDN